MKRIVSFIFVFSTVLFLLSGFSKPFNETKEIECFDSSDNIDFIIGDEFNLTKEEEQQRAFALADLVPETDFDFELTDDYEGVVIKKYKGSSRQIVIPSEIQGVPVVEIGYGSFSLTGVITVVIPDSIQKIGSYSFSFCKRLQYIKLPSGLRSIPEGCFKGCESLNYFIIPETITCIESSAFANTALESIYIPDSVSFSYIDSIWGDECHSSFVFSLCKKLKEVRLPNNMDVLPKGMFSNCESLESITLPENITTIERDVFNKCKSLRTIEIPASVVAIDVGVFDESGLTKLYIPNSVMQLKCTFATCSDLTELHLPDSLTEINSSLFHDFYKVSKIQKVNIPASIKVIGEDAFRQMNELVELEIPDSITKIEFSYPDTNNAFLGCSSLPLATQKRLKQLGYPGKFN
jgi:hypothetical protein